MVNSKIYTSVLVAVTCFVVLLFSACQNSDTDTRVNSDGIEFNPESPFDYDEAIMKKAIAHKLAINPDDATFSFHRAHLNEDEYLDAYVSVNLAKVASRDMEQAKNPASFVDMGYLGNYNYLVVWDGEIKRIGKPYMLSSNGLDELKLAEHNLLDPGYKTISAQYRVRNSAFEIFFRYLNGNIVPVFSYKIIDGIGTDEPEAYVFELQENPTQLQQDIRIYEALIPNYSAEEAMKEANYYPFDNLEKQDRVSMHFFYEKSMQKYATNGVIAE